MKKVEKIDLGTVDTVLADIMEGENDLFNNYTEYDVLKVDQFDHLKQYEVELKFMEDKSATLYINEQEGNNVLEYDVDLSEVY